MRIQVYFPHLGSPKWVRVFHRTTGRKAALFAEIMRVIDETDEYWIQNQPPLPPHRPIRGCDPYTVIAKAMATKRP